MDMTRKYYPRNSVVPASTLMVTPLTWDDDLSPTFANPCYILSELRQEVKILHAARCCQLAKV